MKLFSIVGARPQFIKASVVSRAISNIPNLQEIILHTGQHYDTNMSELFFSQLSIPRPEYSLNISGGSHGAMTGRMLAEIELAIQAETPDRVLVYGDTNSTLAGALAASKLQIPIAHVESGLRSFNPQMPEEINRRLTDQLSDLLFCPTSKAVDNLEREGFLERPVEIHHVGDVMQDSMLQFAQFAMQPAGLPSEQPFILATVHREENTKDPARLIPIVNALNDLHAEGFPVVLPLHPRTRKAVGDFGLRFNVHTIEPVGYLEMLWLLRECSLVLTDSGGLQKEAFFFGKACLTMRQETEWVELIDIGANTLVGTDRDSITAGARERFGQTLHDDSALYGGGEASKKIAARLALDAKKN